MGKPIVTQALVLAGGRGTRLGALTESCPKPLLPVAGRPFLAYLIARLARLGIDDVILSTGYQAPLVRRTLPEGRTLGVNLRHCVETEPAGTGGAVRLASSLLAERFLVLNGDTLFDADVQSLARMLDDHPTAEAAVALREVDDAGRYGRVTLDRGLIQAFAEKSGDGRGLINGGIYCLRRSALAGLPPGASSLERDFFPALAASQRLCGQVFAGYFIDIGLPETLHRAQTELPAWERASMTPSSP